MGNNYNLILLFFVCSSVISSAPLFGFADTGIKSGDYEDQFFEIFEGKGGCNVTLMGAVFTAIEAAHDKCAFFIIFAICHNCLFTKFTL